MSEYLPVKTNKNKTIEIGLIRDDSKNECYIDIKNKCLFGTTIDEAVDIHDLIDELLFFMTQVNDGQIDIGKAKWIKEVKQKVTFNDLIVQIYDICASYHARHRGVVEYADLCSIGEQALTMALVNANRAQNTTNYCLKCCRNAISNYCKKESRFKKRHISVDPGVL